jgi:hypothetical protein
MSKRSLEYGDLVKIKIEEASEWVGIVTQPITEQSPGHVLIHKDGYILGVKVTIDDVVPAEMNTQGFAQLAYNLIKLGSHVIEKKLIE